MAFQKGLLVFSSAGNEGNNTWKHIIAPADGENVIGVAAVDKNGLRATFSSVGPSSGGAVKPNAAAMGSGTTLVISNGTIGYANGTSFSSPVLAGMGACLLQANPYAGAKMAKLAIEQSASQYNKPDSLLGYGIPDFEKADKYLKVNSATYFNLESFWVVSPNPFTDFLFVRNLNNSIDEICVVSIYNLQGICLWQSTFKSEGTIILKNLANLPQGFLILSIRSGEKEERIKLVRIAQ
jgi:subtilisin family serine protease